MVSRFDAAAIAVSCGSISAGLCAAMAPSAAAIRLPEPTPAPMASERGSKMCRLAMKPASTAMKSAPSTVPVMYSASTPRPSGEAMPYFSPMITRLPSRPTEKVAPTASRLMPSSSASGRPSARVPSAWPNSWNSSAQPACFTCGSAAPTVRPSFTTNSSRPALSRPPASDCCAVATRTTPGTRRCAMPQAAAMSSAHSIGSSTTLPGPTLNCVGPMSSATATRTRVTTRSLNLPAAVDGATAAIVEAAEVMGGGCSRGAGEFQAASLLHQ
ncbi:hypothetical protein D3C86_933190 [compost metagenome]